MNQESKNLLVVAGSFLFLLVAYFSYELKRNIAQRDFERTRLLVSLSIERHPGDKTFTPAEQGAIVSWLADSTNQDQLFRRLLVLTKFLPPDSKMEKPWVNRIPIFEPLKK